jgi:lysophospholipase L1-like esterase
MSFFLSDPDFQPSFKIRHQDVLCFMGSCFSDTMVRYFYDRKYTTLSNPHGIIYNPVSLVNSFDNILKENIIDRKMIYEQDGSFSSFMHHSKLKAKSEEGLVHLLQTKNGEAKSFLKNTDVIFITLGTAWVYWHKELRQVVANNLKAPASLFDKKLLKISEIESALQQIIDSLRSMNHEIKIILTVSPVRHTKQGLANNNRSKARLIEAVHNCIAQNAEITYFPSYEIIMDVLRSYRFFEKDRVHPNQEATDYMWSFIREKLILEDDYILLEKLQKLFLATQHKLFQKESKASKNFVQSQLKHISELEQSYSYLNLEEERKHFSQL